MWSTSEGRVTQKLTVEDERILARCVGHEVDHGLFLKFGFPCKRYEHEHLLREKLTIFSLDGQRLVFLFSSSSVITTISESW
jgi:hypothetical protein